MHTLKIVMAAEFIGAAFVALGVAAGIDWNAIILALIGLSVPYMIYRQHMADKRAEEAVRAEAVRAEEKKAAAKIEAAAEEKRRENMQAAAERVAAEAAKQAADMKAAAERVAAEAAKRADELRAAALQTASAVNEVKQVAAEAAKRVADVKTALDQTTESAAQKAEEVRTALEVSDRKNSDKLDAMAKVTQDTHTLVNSNMEIQLHVNEIATALAAEALRELADIKPTSERVARAEIAERAALEAKDKLAVHKAKQVIVDEGDKVETK